MGGRVDAHALRGAAVATAQAGWQVEGGKWRRLASCGMAMLSLRDARRDGEARHDNIG